MTVDLKDPLLELQRAMVQALNGDADLTALGVTVYDRVNENDYPFITIGEDRENPDDTYRQTMTEVFSTVRVYTQTVGKVQAKQIAGKVRWLLDKDHGSMFLNGFKLMAGHCTNIAIRDHEDGITVQAEINFDYMIVPTDPAGNLRRTLADVSLTGEATLVPGGFLVATLAPLISTGNGSLISNNNLIATLDDVTLAGNGVSLTGGSLNQTLEALSCASDASLPITGDLSDTLGDLTVTSESNTLTEGNLSVTLDDMQGTGSGGVFISATLNETLEDAESNGFGTSGSGANLNVTLSDLSTSSTSKLIIAGQLASALDDASLTGSSSLIASGSLAQGLEGLSASGSGQLIISGDLLQTLKDINSASDADIDITASLAQTLGDLTVTGSAGSVIQGSLNETLGEVTSAGVASLIISASLTQTLASATSTSSAALATSGALTSTLDDVASTADASLLISASLSETLDAVASTTSAGFVISGDLSQTLGALTLNGSGTLASSSPTALSLVRGEHTAGNDAMYIEMQDFDNMWQASSDTFQVQSTPPTGAYGVIGLIADIAQLAPDANAGDYITNNSLVGPFNTQVPGNHWYASITSNRWTAIDETTFKSLQSDENNDLMNVDMSAFTDTVSFFMSMRMLAADTSDGGALFYVSSGTDYLGRAAPNLTDESSIDTIGGANVTYRVDGVKVRTPAELYDMIDDDAWHVVSIEGIDGNDLTNQVRPFYRSGFNYTWNIEGRIAHWLALPDQSVANRDVIEQELAGVVGATITDNEYSVEKFKARMNATPTTAVEDALKKLIRKLKDDGIWYKLDGLILHGLPDSADALLNVVQDNYHMSNLGSHTHTPGVGIIGNSNTAIDAPNLSSGDNWTADSAHYGCRFKYDDSENQSIFYEVIDSAYGGIYVESDGTFYYSLGASFAQTTNALSGTVQQNVIVTADRIGATNAVYVDGADFSAPSLSPAAMTYSSNNLFLEGAGAPELAVTHWGGHLTAAEASDLSDALDTWAVDIAAA